jgi:hypothetical protein
MGENPNSYTIPADMDADEYTFRLLAAQLAQAKRAHKGGYNQTAASTLRDMTQKVALLAHRLRDISTR